MSKSPAAIIFDSNGVEKGTEGNPLRIDPSGDTAQPISAETLPLPTGAATETTLGNIKSKTDNIPASPAQEHTAANSPSSVRLTDGTTFFKPTTPSDTQPISAASLPLPAGAATETTLGNIKSKTDNLDVALSTKATEATLLNIKGKTDNIPTDPATDTKLQNILTELGQKTEPADLQKAVLHNTAGNPVTVNLRDGVYRIAVDVRQSEGQPSAIGQSVPANLARYYRKFLTASGGGTNFNVNGSSTPVVFSAVADPLKDTFIQEIRVVISAQDLVFDGSSFGKIGLLTNGILFEIVNEYGTQEIAVIKSNEELLFFPSPVGILLNNTGPKDVLIAGFYLGAGPKLRAGTSDVIKATVRDNLTTAFDFMKALGYGMIAE